jgi:hypothetical protein
VILENIMSLMKTTSTLPLFVVLTALVAGCGQANPNLSVDPSNVDLEDIYRSYRMFIKSHQRPPAALSELQEVRGLHPGAFQLLREGKYAVVWGLKDRDPDTVLAYEKDAPIQGGWAVMADGKIKRLDSEAFQTVPTLKK